MSSFYHWVMHYVFGKPHSLATITADLDSTMSKLADHAARKKQEHADHKALASEHIERADAASFEAARAEAISGNLKNLLAA